MCPSILHVDATGVFAIPGGDERAQICRNSSTSRPSMSAAIKASALPIVINLLGIFGVAYQIGNFKGEIAAKVAALEATDLRHDRQIEALQGFMRKTAGVNSGMEDDAAIR